MESLSAGRCEFYLMTFMCNAFCRQDTDGGRADYAAAEEEDEAAGGAGDWHNVQYAAAGAATAPQQLAL
jgi:hypothetical protein